MALITDPLPDTLEAAVEHLERWKWCWKLTSYLDKDGHRTYRALVYRLDCPQSRYSPEVPAVQRSRPTRRAATRREH